MSSLLASIQAKVDSLTAANFPGAAVPPIYEDTAPQVKAGLALRRPYFVLSFAANEDFLTFESDSMEDTRVTLIAFADSQADADAMMKAARFNGQTVDQCAGLDCGTLPALDDGVLLALLPYRAPVPGFVGLGEAGQNVYKTTMEYMVSVQRT